MPVNGGMKEMTANDNFGPNNTAKLKRPAGVRAEGDAVAGSSAAVGVEARLLPRRRAP